MSYPPDFERFWQSWPRWARKQGKLDALKAWRQVKEYRPELEEVIQAVERASRSKQWKDGYAPMPSTWLRRGGWDDEYEEITQRPETGYKGLQEVPRDPEKAKAWAEWRKARGIG